MKIKIKATKKRTTRMQNNEKDKVNISDLTDYVTTTPCNTQADF